MTENEKLKRDGSATVMKKEDTSSDLQLSKLCDELNVLQEKNAQLKEEISKLNQNKIDSITDEFSEDLE